MFRLAEEESFLMAKRQGIKNAFLLFTGFLTCPCHLPLVLPVLAGLLAGTAAGAFIAQNSFLLMAMATIYFVGVVVYFMRGSPDMKRLGSSKDDAS